MSPATRGGVGTERAATEVALCRSQKGEGGKRDGLGERPGLPLPARSEPTAGNGQAKGPCARPITRALDALDEPLPGRGRALRARAPSLQRLELWERAREEKAIGRGDNCARTIDQTQSSHNADTLRVSGGLKRSTQPTQGLCAAGRRLSGVRGTPASKLSPSNPKRRGTGRHTHQHKAQQGSQVPAGTERSQESVAARQTRKQRARGSRTAACAQRSRRRTCSRRFCLRRRLRRSRCCRWRHHAPAAALRAWQ